MTSPSETTQPQCDFCSSPYPIAHHHCKSFDMMPVPWGSIGDWAACPPCHLNIVQGQWDELIDRAVQDAAALHHVFEGELRPAIARLISTFRRQRNGRHTMIEGNAVTDPDAPLLPHETPPSS